MGKEKKELCFGKCGSTVCTCNNCTTSGKEHKPFCSSQSGDVKDCHICMATSDWLDRFRVRFTFGTEEQILLEDFIATELKKAREEERKRVLDIIDSVSWEDMNCVCNMCYAHKKAITTIKQRIGVV